MFLLKVLACRGKKRKWVFPIPRNIVQEETRFPFKIDFLNPGNVIPSTIQLCFERYLPDAYPKKIRYIVGLPSRSFEAIARTLQLYSREGLVGSSRTNPLCFSVFLNKRFFLLADQQGDVYPRQHDYEASLPEGISIQLKGGYWSPVWRSRNNESIVAFECVRDFFYAQKSNLPEEEIDFITAQESKPFKGVPFTDLRQVVEDMAQQFSEAVSQRPAPTYYVTADDDARSLIECGKGVFTRSSSYIKRWCKRHKTLPLVLSGGYAISKEENPFISLAVKMDMAVREYLVGSDISSYYVYFPEPFTVFLAKSLFFETQYPKTYRQPKNRKSENPKSCENKQKVLAMRGRGLTQERMFFSSELMIETTCPKRMTETRYSKPKMFPGSFSREGILMLWNENTLITMRGVSQSHWKTRKLLQVLTYFINDQKPGVDREGVVAEIKALIHLHEPVELARMADVFPEHRSFHARLCLILSEPPNTLVSHEIIKELRSYVFLKEKIGEELTEKVLSIIQGYGATLHSQLKEHLSLDPQEKLYRMMSFACDPHEKSEKGFDISIASRFHQKILSNDFKLLDQKGKMELGQFDLSNLHLAAFIGNKKFVDHFIDRELRNKKHFVCAHNQLSPFIAGVIHLIYFDNEDIGLLERLLRVTDIQVSTSSKEKTPQVALCTAQKVSPLGYVLSHSSDRLDLVEFLLENGAPPTQHSYDWQVELILPPSFIAISHSKDPIPILEMLFSKGAGPAEVDCERQTLLTHAIHGFVSTEETACELATFLLDRAPALVNKENGEGETPLSLAIEFGYKGLSSVLMEKGAEFEEHTKELRELGIKVYSRAEKMALRRKKQKKRLRRVQRHMFARYVKTGGLEWCPAEERKLLFKNPDLFFPLSLIEECV